MQPEQVQFLTHYYLQGIENEAKATCKVVGAVPDDKSDYRPHPTSRSARELAWHIVNSDVWFLNSIHGGSFSMEEEKIPQDIKTSSDMVNWYQKKLAEGIAKVRGMGAEQLARPVDFFGVYNLPAGMYLGFLNNHSIHHRGQLSAYLRPMGAKVPNIYGGSADEPMF